jgi:glycosyltransferase involved in cell wall biosynthesis
MKQHGCKLIYETDDVLIDGHIPKWNPGHNVLSSQGIQDCIKGFLKICDAVFVTNQGTANIYGKYNKNVFILPNSIDFTKFSPMPGNSGSTGVLWQGSGTHQEDLNLMGDALGRLAQNPNVSVKIWGDHTIAGTQHVSSVNFEHFYSTLAKLDAKIGLAPLLPCLFNACKSNLKVLEYAAQGMVPVASAFGNYRDTITDGTTGLLVSDNTTWYNRVMELIQNPSLLNQLRQNAFDMVNEKFNIDKNYKLWEAAIETVYNQP